MLICRAFQKKDNASFSSKNKHDHAVLKLTQKDFLGPFSIGNGSSPEQPYLWKQDFPLLVLY